jgi:ComF family protein
VVVGDELAVAVAAFAYRGTLRRALARLKYGGAARLAGPLAIAASPLLAGFVGRQRPAALVPVPVHPGRLRQRGYNQAALLACAMGKEWKLDVADLLVRERPTTQQHRLSRAERLRNLAGAFSVRTDCRIPPRVILVDDILTTSATLESCARVLRATGAEWVVGISVGREI